MHPARSGDRNIVGGDRHLPDRGIGFLRRGDRYTLDRWNVSGGVVIPPVTGLNDGDPVALWKDSSSKGHDAVASGTTRPTFKTYVVNGLPVVRFNSAAKTILTMANKISSVSPFTVLGVVRSPSKMVGLGVTTSNTPFEFETDSVGGSVFFSNRTGYAVFPSLGSYPSTFSVWAFKDADVSYSTCYVNGINATGNFGALAGTNDFDSMGVQGPLATGQFSDGDIAELLFFNVQLSDTDRRNLQQYLGHKYGISVTDGGTAVDPSTVTGLEAWYKADSLWTPPALLNDGDPVSMWPDFSGLGHNATQTGTARPTFKTNIINGKPVVRFTSAGLQGLNLAALISGASPWTIFAVTKQATSSSQIVSLANEGTSAIWGPLQGADGVIYIRDRGGYDTTGNLALATFQILTGISSGVRFLWSNGTSASIGAPVGSPNTLDFIALGYRPGVGSGFYSDGDIAEIIFYSGPLAIRAKLLVVLTVLITTGQIPSTAEADALLASGDLVALEAYLIEHGVSVEQARDTLEPMAVGDRANIEKYLSTKYGIAVTSGGTAVDPSTVAGMQGWWKADSLSTPPSSLLTGLISYWKLDEVSGTRMDSAGTNHLSENGGTIASVAGVQGNGIFVNNAAGNQFLNHASNPSLQMSGNTDFTIAAWVKIPTGFNGSLVTKDSSVANSRDYTFDFSNNTGTSNTLRFYIKGGATYIASAPLLQLTKWCFAVAWYDSSNGQLHLRLNDIATYDSIAGITGTDVSNAEFRIGARQYIGVEDYATAYIDEVGLWKRKLTPAEMTLLYNGGAGNTYPLFNVTAPAPPFNPATIPGLLGWWRADGFARSLLGKPAPAEGEEIPTPRDGESVSIWPDSSGNGNPMNGVAHFYTTMANGRPALSFAANFYMATSNAPVAQPVTVFTVARKTSPNTGPAYLLGDTFQTVISVGVNGILSIEPYQGATITDAIDHSVNWHVFTVQLAGGLATGWVDGANTIPAVGGVSQGIGNLGRFFLDANGNPVGYGDVAEHLVYNTALSTTNRQNVENYLKAKYGL